MTLSPGSRLGAYEIVGPLGAGGMGEVFRARDTKLNRDVALKILPEAFTQDPDRIARFKREAQVLASLNHPHIAQIYGLEEQEEREGQPPVAFIVMELADGEDLAQRIGRGPLAIDDALPIARQIADALETAHEQGIVHRDLKPANIKVRADGTVKVLDFGLAKAIDVAQGFSPAGDRSPEALRHLATASPTITTPAMTQAGMILGTAAYMSPEQAKGRAADKRSDIWAFGCVVYEMLTGKRPFEGEDISDTLAAVLRGDPDWTALPATTPPNIRTLLQRCLQKDPKKRLPHIGIARLEIDEADGTAPIVTPAAAAPAPRAWWRRAIPYAIAAGVASGITALVAERMGQGRIAQSPPVQRLTIALPPTAVLQITSLSGVAISADGTRVVYVGSSPDGNRSLYLRLLDELGTRQLPGTENASDPFFAPDGESVGFTVGNPGAQTQLLKKAAVRGGGSVTIASLQGLSVGGSWGADGDIRIAQTRGPIGGPGQLNSVYVVAASGGSVQPIPALAATDGRSYGWPDVLPDGRHMLVSVRTGILYNDAHIDVTSLDGKTIRTVVDNGYHGRYVASGHIVYMFARNLMAVPFDIAQLRPTGSPMVIAENIGLVGNARGQENFAVSQTGVLVHGGVMAAANAPKRMLWVDRKGREEPIPAEHRPFTYPRISPDGSRVAIDVRDESNDIWIWDFSRRNLSRLTSDPAQDTYPVWSRDGRRIAFGSSRGGQFNVYAQNADGTGDAERLTDGQTVKTPNSISPDGTQLVVREQSQESDDLMVLALKDERIPTNPRPMAPLVRTKFNERNAEVSPDGRWLAYQSDESGRDEVYVRPFPHTDAGRWTISSDGGTRPVWARNGRELYYVVGATPSPIRMMRVAVDTTKGFAAAVPQQLFEGRYYVDPRSTIRGRTYDVSPDGQQFLMLKDTDPSEPSSQSLVVVLNWEELAKRAPSR